jgi:DMSO/TMAO reductase YedYZ molybdopterin-dependent catalytic subunit
MILTNQVGVITPNPVFYVRNHFPIPSFEPSWKLAIAGAVARPTELTYDQVLALPRRTLVVTLECAGNGRADLQPHAEGEPWQYGAVSTAEWSGVPLSALLETAGLLPTACEVLIAGADCGPVPAVNQSLAFVRSLPRSQALHPDTLLAYAMNGEPLPAAHGYPLRLVVPGWYGMA